MNTPDSWPRSYWPFIKHGPDGTDHKGERVFLEINEALGSQLRRFGFIRTSPESLSATLAANASPARTRASRRSNSSIVRSVGDLQDRHHEVHQKYRDDSARGLLDR